MPFFKTKPFPLSGWLKQLSVMTERLIKMCYDQEGSQAGQPLIESTQATSYK